jgi:hypothetical protein
MRHFLIGFLAASVAIFLLTWSNAALVAFILTAAVVATATLETWGIDPFSVEDSP